MNNQSIMLANSPLGDISYKFGDYLNKKKKEHSRHMLGNGITDYAYKTDLELRKKLDSIPGAFNTLKKIGTTYVMRELKMANMNDLAVGPNQFPEVYEMACDCAKRLGIAVPNVYIRGEDQFNAFTCACDDIEPFIVVYGTTLKRTTPGELKAIIAHECGHIHNYHSLYTIIENYLMTIGQNAAYGIGGALLAQFQQIMTQGFEITLRMWSRAAEVTADRAALICCDNLEDAYNVNMKFMYGGYDLTDKITTDMDLDSLREQYEMVNDSSARLMELWSGHPLSVKRIFAEMEFAQCDVLYKWRPDLRTPGCVARSKELTDERCKKIVDVVRGKESRK